MIELISMDPRITPLAPVEPNSRLDEPKKKRRKRPDPLPIRDGLNPSRVRVSEEAHGMTAREFVDAVIDTQRHRHPEDDLAGVDKRFADQLVVTASGDPLSAGDIVQAGQDVWFYRVPAPESHVPYDIAVLHEDDQLLVVDKPPFLATFPRGSHITESVLVRMRRATQNSELSPAHRLDRLTSGVLVLTKTREVRGAYQTLFAARQVDKVYEAIAEFSPLIIPGTTWEHRMEKERGEFQTRIVEGEINARTVVNSVVPLEADVNEALVRAHSLSQDVQLARYELHPLTGRTHQLRLHMHLAGTPILGDPIYPRVLPVDAEDFAVPMHLLSRTLSFVDPFTGEKREFRSRR